jgi:hypothetical protein
MLWAALFMVLAMCREIHFSGSDEALLIGWPLLLLVVLWRREIFKFYPKEPGFDDRINYPCLCSLRL